ncbi:MAG TPA: hypothetical protein PK347_14915, partial [Burkholderiaceae bacterium]|nr:hypothetical protein [Burkholderiaceae bacterium]
AGGQALQGVRTVHLAFAVPDHPWVDGANGAAVRIAMTVVAPGAGEGARHSVTAETAGEHGEVAVTLATQTGLVHADLAVGANVAAVVPLQAMGGVSSPGVKLHGAGFIVTPEEAAALAAPALVKPYRNGRDLTDKPRGVSVIDAFGLSAEQLLAQHPAVYQWLFDRVKPERDQNNRATYRDNWWIFGEPRRDLRPALAGLPRYIATVETAKHRTFQFLDASVLPDNKLIAIALADAFHLGVLSSEVHVRWSLATGSWLGVGNDPVYVKTRCFEAFPFPEEHTGLTPALRERIATLAQHIDDHRKRVLGLPPVTALSPASLSPSPTAHMQALAGLGQSGAGRADFGAFDRMRPGPPPTDTAPPGSITPNGEAKAPVHKDLTLTNLYNVREALRAGRPLTDKEKAIHTLGLVGVLHSLHTELDAAVLQAYGWADLSTGLASAPDTEPHTVATAELLHRLVALNTRRAAEEAQGTVRWLRPDFQNPGKNTAITFVKQEQSSLINQAVESSEVDERVVENNSVDSAPNSASAAATAASATAVPVTQPWPSTLPEQVRAVAQVLVASPVPLSVDALAQRFKGKGPWKKGLPTLLQTLQALGRAQLVGGSDAEGEAVLWRGI